MIPKTAYLRFWHQTHTPDSFRQSLRDALAAAETPEGTLTGLEKALLLQGVSLFADLAQDDLLALADKTEELFVATGEQVFDRGDKGDSLYVVVEGSLLVHDGEQHLAQLGAKEVFGEMAVLTPEPRMASVTATADSHLLQVSQDSLDELFDANPAVARAVIGVLAQRLRRGPPQSAQNE